MLMIFAPIVTLKAESSSHNLSCLYKVPYKEIGITDILHKDNSLSDGEMSSSQEEDPANSTFIQNEESRPTTNVKMKSWYING